MKLRKRNHLNGSTQTDMDPKNISDHQVVTEIKLKAHEAFKPKVIYEYEPAKILRSAATYVQEPAKVISSTMTMTTEWCNEPIGHRRVSIGSKLSPLEFLRQNVLPRLSPEKAFGIKFTHKAGLVWTGICPFKGCKDSCLINVDPITLRYECQSGCGEGHYLSFLDGGKFSTASDLKGLLLKAGTLAGVEVPQNLLDQWKNAEAEEKEGWKSNYQAEEDSYVFIKEAHAILDTNQPESNETVKALVQRGIPTRDEAPLIGYFPSERHSHIEHLALKCLSSADIEKCRGKIVLAVRDRHGKPVAVWCQGETPAQGGLCWFQPNNVTSSIYFGSEKVGTGVASDLTIYLVQDPLTALWLQARENIIAIAPTSPIGLLGKDQLRNLSTLGIPSISIIFPERDHVEKSILLNSLYEMFSEFPKIDVRLVPLSSWDGSVPLETWFTQRGDKSQKAEFEYLLKTWDISAVEYYHKERTLADVTCFSSASTKDWAMRKTHDLLILLGDRLGPVTKDKIIDRTIGTLEMNKKLFLKILARREELSHTINNEIVGETVSPMKLISSIADKCELFRTSEGELFGRLEADDHYEILGIEGKYSPLSEFLNRECSRRIRTIPGESEMKKVMDTIRAKAKYDGNLTELFTRIGRREDSIYLDLCDPARTCIEITREGWGPLKGCAPVLFRRTNGMLPLPMPEKGGSLTDLKQLINYGTEENFILMAGFLVGCFSQGPFAHLVIHGQQGAAKSSTMQNLAAIIDPNEKAFRRIPSDEKSYAITVRNSLIVTFDNLSSLTPAQSDVLCRLATGDVYASRKPHTDDIEKIIKTRRPVIMNAIGELVVRGDLLERSIIVTLPGIDYDKRKTEKMIRENLYKLHPGILGAILDAVSAALRNLDRCHPPELPRLADFATFVESACECLPWDSGVFLKTLKWSQDQNASSEMDASLLGQAIRQWTHQEQMMDPSRSIITMQGPATELWKILSDTAHRSLPRTSDFPKSPSAFSGELNRIQPMLEKLGYQIERSTNNGGDKIIRISFDSNQSKLTQRSNE